MTKEQKKYIYDIHTQSVLRLNAIQCKINELNVEKEKLQREISLFEDLTSCYWF